MDTDGGPGMDFELHWNGEQAMIVLPDTGAESEDDHVSILVDAKKPSAVLAFRDVPKIRLSVADPSMIEDLARLDAALVIEADDEGRILRGYDGIVTSIG